MRRIWRALALGALSFAAMAAGDWRPSDDDALLLDVRLGQYRLGNGVGGYRTPQGACINLSDITHAIDVPIVVDPGQRIAAGWAFEEGNVLRVDRGAGRVRTRGGEAPLGAGDVHDTPEGWCVDTRALSTWLGIGLDPDFANALLLVSSSAELPVERAAKRRARAARIRPAETIDLGALPQARLPYEWWRMPAIDAVVAIGGLADKKNGRAFEREFELYAAGEIARLSFDARLSSDTEGAPTDLRARLYRSDAEANLLGPLHASHFAVGDVASFASPLVSQSTAGRGAVVTNRPIELQERFDRKTFRGELPNGWDAEIYRNGQLLDVAQDRADGRYEFIDVPLLYGQNRFEIVLYGPQGQVRRAAETVFVGAQSIPPRETYYWAGASQDGRDLVDLRRDRAAFGRGWRYGVGVERGLDTRTSVAGSIQSLMHDGDRAVYGEAAIRRSMGPALIEAAASVRSGGGMAARAHLLAQVDRTYITAESIVARGGFLSDRVDGGVTGVHLLALDHSFDLERTAVPVHVEARYVTRADGRDRLEGGARVSAMLGRMSITAAVDGHVQALHGFDASERVVEAALLANGSVGRARLRGEMRWRIAPEARFESAALMGQIQIAEDRDLRGEIGYDHSFGRVRGAIGYARRFNRFALSVDAEAASDGSVAAGLNLAFSLGPDPRGRGFRVTSNKIASGGSALVRVFHDDNQDGVRQAGEAPARDVQLLIGRAPAALTTGDDGLTTLDGLEPHRPVLIGVDASSLDDPLTRPAGPGIVVTPRAGVGTAIEPALVSAGEVVGTLVGPGGRMLEGLDLEIIADDGRIVVTTRSDFDGYFLFESVPYGRYRLRIAPAAASSERLIMSINPDLVLDARSPTVRLGRVTVDAAPVIASK